MDVHNVAVEYRELIERQKQTLREARKRQGQRPHDRKPREYAYSKFMLALMFTDDKNAGHLVHSSFIPPAYPPCITAVAELKHIAIQDLQLEIHHRGAYLLLQCITPPSRMTAIMVLTEDKNGDVVMLQIYQQEDEEIRPATDIVNTGTVLLVKEPYFKVMGDGEYGLRIDHLSDIVYLKSNDARVPSDWQPRVIEVEHSAESLKLKGNLAMKEGRFWDAITIYSDALAQPTVADEADILKRNRSLAYLRTKQFDAALSDTGFPNFHENSSEKAMFRAADALYNLKQFDECCQVLDILCRGYPLNDLSRVASDRARSRSREQKTGDYNFKLLQAQAKKIRPPHLDHATYIGPVEVRQTASKGRGLFLTKAVKAGDLLLCEKAFVHSHADEGSAEGKGSSSKISLLINAETDKGVMGAQSELLKTIVQKLYRNPSLALAFTALYHGDYNELKTTAVDEMPIVDTFLVERIISLNVFGCPVSSLNSHAKYRDRSSSSHVEDTKDKGYHSCGIWTQASYINHNCNSNARRAFIGDMMIVRATRDLEADTEISFWYHSPHSASEKDLQKNLKHWGFVCGCAMCSDARSTGPAVLNQRRVLRESMKQAFKLSSSRGAQVQKIERLLEELNQTYSQPADEVPRILIWDPQLALARLYASQNQMRKCIKAAGKVLISLGFVVVGADSSQTPFSICRWGLLVDDLVDTFLLLRNCFIAINATKNSERAEEYGRTTYKMIVGEDVSFNSLYGKEVVLI